MRAEADITPPFGTYALPDKNETWRQRARNYPDTVWGRAMISLCRKQAMRGQSEPFDIIVEHGIHARVFPGDNRTDKRVFAGPQIWETTERKALETLIGQASPSRPFVFLDIGANSGFYSLYVDHYAKAHKIPTKIIAIEPGLETCVRLQNNITASQANIQMIKVAVSDAPGQGYLSVGHTNRGEAKLSSPSEGHERVIIDTLSRICSAQGLDHVDALKMDIEGHEHTALSGFFQDAPDHLHPSMMIIETRHQDQAAPVIEICAAHDYVVSESTRQNSIFIKNTNV